MLSITLKGKKKINPSHEMKVDLQRGAMYIRVGLDYDEEVHQFYGLEHYVRLRHGFLTRWGLHNGQDFPCGELQTWMKT